MSLSKEAKEALSHSTSRPELMLGQICATGIISVAKLFVSRYISMANFVYWVKTGYDTKEEWLIRKREIEQGVQYPAKHNGESQSFYNVPGPKTREELKTYRRT